jgi:hypothetical protein
MAIHKANEWKESGIHLHLHKENQTVLMQNCSFDGINHAGFITYAKDNDPFFGNKQRSISIEDCVFKHCVAGVIDKNNNHLHNENESISIRNCTGLDGTEGGQADNPVVWEKNADGEPIGANLDESDVGVPLYQTA